MCPGQPPDPLSSDGAKAHSSAPVTDPGVPHALSVLGGRAAGRVVAMQDGLSFWGGVDPATGIIIDAHHPLRGTSVAGAILVMPTSRGSCSGSGVLLDLAIAGRAPAALIFGADEDVLTLGALVAARMFDRPLPVLRVPPDVLQALGRASSATIDEHAIEAEDVTVPVLAAAPEALRLSEADERMLAGGDGEAVRQAMQILCAMAVNQGADAFLDVTQAHIDGCIYASPANLLFADRMANLGGWVRVPTTTNAISVDHESWRRQGVSDAFGDPASRLADAYVRMGCRPSFTCSPYLLESAPGAGECIGWAESNAVIFANSVLGARTAKHPDFLDLCIALTGRAPKAGAYTDAGRKARRILDVHWPDGADDAIWPLIGYLAGQASPDRIPLLRGLAGRAPSPDDLKALCAAFGTTSAAPMLHIEGVTPIASGTAGREVVAEGADRVAIGPADFAAAWSSLNEGSDAIDLVAFGSPHASLTECEAIADAFGERRRSDRVAVIVTAGRGVIAKARRAGVLDRLERAGVQVLPDLCWCSISEPVFPPATRTVMTNSGKYAHYGPGLSGRAVRFGSLQDCVRAAIEGAAPARLPGWLSATPTCSHPPATASQA